jgi:hypothetical protein
MEGKVIKFDQLHASPDRRYKNMIIAGRECNRVPVTAKYLWEHPDKTGYYFSHLADEVGLDPWVTIQGMDMIRNSGELVLEFNGMDEKVVCPEYVVFI